MRTPDHQTRSMLAAMAWAAALTAALGMLGAGCATPPRRSVNAEPGAAAADQAAPAPASSGQSTAQQPSASTGGDVDFEEDQLPGAPEDVSAAPIDGSGSGDVEVEELAEEAAPAPPVAPAAGPARAPSVVTPVAPSVQTPAPGSTARMLLGFRVQVHAGENRVEAEQLAREAEARLHVPAYTTFEAPFYKVRLGDFLDRAEAQVLRDRVRGYGYPGAWVVPTPVYADAAAAAGGTRAP